MPQKQCANRREPREVSGGGALPNDVLHKKQGRSGMLSACGLSQTESPRGGGVKCTGRVPTSVHPHTGFPSASECSLALQIYFVGGALVYSHTTRVGGSVVGGRQQFVQRVLGEVGSSRFWSA